MKHTTRFLHHHKHHVLCTPGGNLICPSSSHPLCLPSLYPLTPRTDHCSPHHTSNGHHGHINWESSATVYSSASTSNSSSKSPAAFGMDLNPFYIVSHNYYGRPDKNPQLIFMPPPMSLMVWQYRKQWRHIHTGILILRCTCTKDSDDWKNVGMCYDHLVIRGVKWIGDQVIDDLLGWEH